MAVLRARFLVGFVVLHACGGGTGTDGDASATDTSAPTTGSAGSEAGPGSSAGPGGDDPTTASAEAGSSVDDADSTDTSDTQPMPGHDCSDPAAAWLFCEDFEAGGGDWAAWFLATDFVTANPEDDRGRIDLATDQVHGGSFAIKYPAAPESGYQGATLEWWACDGAQEVNCPLRNFDTLYFRSWVRFAEDHQLVHHFLTMAGSQPDDFWDHGSAGCMPNGELELSTVVDVREGTHESFFYSYSLDMQCDPNCGNYADVAAICQECADKGLPTCDEQQQCCWGDNLEPPAPVALPLGEWFCLEMMMTVNTPGEADGVMEYWVDDQPGHRVDGMRWRTSPTLGLNRVWLHHYITEGDAMGHSNQVWFDDTVVSTERIGCD